jgi:uncharacterized protein
MEKKFALQIILLMVLALGAVALGFNQKFVSYLTKSLGGTPPATQQVTTTKIARILDGANNQEKARVNIELADTSEKRTKGLGGRSSLGTDSGMLFIHNNSSKYTYWMKGMQISLDILWILDDTVADILTNVPPEPNVPDDKLQKYSSKVPVNRVLEVNTGYVNSKNIKVGDKVIIEDKSTLSVPETQPSVEIIIEP